MHANVGESIAYLYQYQLQAFFNSSSQQHVGVAYEWKGEGVYHAYLDYPKVTPSGLPASCMFAKAASREAFDNAFEAYASANNAFYASKGYDLGL